MIILWLQVLKCLWSCQQESEVLYERNMDNRKYYQGQLGQLNGI